MTKPNFTIELESFTPEELKEFAEQQKEFSIDLLKDSSFQIPSNWLPVKSNKWRKLVPLGYQGQHPQYGHIDFTAKYLESFYKNAKDNVLGRPLWFNFNHQNGPAGIWPWDYRLVKDKNGQPVELQYKGKYTPAGLRAIIGEEYKFVSVEFRDDFKSLGPTLCNAAMTNDPFVVGEGLTELENTEKEGDSDMSMPKEFTEALKRLETLEGQVTQLKAEKDTAVLEKKKLEAEIAKKSQQKEETKKLETTAVDTVTPEVKKLQVELTSYRRELLKTKVEGFQSKMLHAGIYKPCVDKALEYIKGSENATVRLEKSPGVIEQSDVMVMCENILLSIPTDRRVNLKAEDNSGVWVDYNKVAKLEGEENDLLVADAKARSGKGA